MAATASDARSFDDGRDETPPERLDRNATELVQEMRVAAVGIQVLLAFLLVVPFQTGWKHVTSFDRYEYFVTLDRDRDRHSPTHCTIDPPPDPVPRGREGVHRGHG